MIEGHSRHSSPAGPSGSTGPIDLITLRERMYLVGSIALSTSELIALVLGTGAAHSPLELAERLYTQYGGLVGIAHLGLPGLLEVEGIGLAKATQLRAALDLHDRLKLELVTNRQTIRTPADAAALCMPEMCLQEQEHLRTVLLDKRNRVVAVHDVYRGSRDSIGVQPVDVFREAVRRNSASIIVAHSHPSGDASPSSEDIQCTRTLVQAGKVLGIDLLDHLIIGQGQFVSLKERGLGFD